MKMVSVIQIGFASVELETWRNSDDPHASGDRPGKKNHEPHASERLSRTPPSGAGSQPSGRSCVVNMALSTRPSDPATVFDLRGTVQPTTSISVIARTGAMR